MFWGIFGFCLELIIFTMIIMAFQMSVLLGGVLFLLWLYVGPGTITYEFAELDKGIEFSVGKPEEESPLADLIGKEGKTVSIMRPVGKVEVNGQRYDAMARSVLFLAADLPIIVVEARNKTLIVQELITDTYETIDGETVS